MKVMIKKINFYKVAVIAMILVTGMNFYIFSRTGKKEGVHASVAKTTCKVTNPIISAGRIRQFGDASANFTIVNQGEHYLFIQAITPDCHCTTALWDKRPIKPGDSTVVKIKYDSSILGFFQKKILVEVNSDDSPLLLIFRGEVYL
jgi:hypothetical protein